MTVAPGAVDVGMVVCHQTTTIAAGEGSRRALATGGDAKRVREHGVSRGGQIGLSDPEETI